jgi:hypothetical protein
MMKKALVRCRCGHQVLAREVLRTDLYERSMGREYVYVKFRCKRCKRMGEAFVAENRWDWSILEPAPGEMNAEERDRFLDAEEISDADVEAFHRHLEAMSDLSELTVAPQSEAVAGEAAPEAGKTPPSENRDPRPEAPPNNTSQNVASNVAPDKGASPQKRPPTGDDKRPHS